MFHRAIAHEQMREISAFLRSTLPVTKLAIEMRADKHGEFGVRGSYEGVSGGGKFTARESHMLGWEGEYDDLQLVPLEHELVWMEKFKNIQEGVRGATGGRFTVTEQADRRFGFAKQIGIDASLEAMHKLTVMVEFG